MYKIALNAGHYIGTAGKRCLKALDKNETREWTLNNRICDKVEKLLADYNGYTLLRVDDTTGKTDVSILARAKKANDFGADVYISVHHNAGVGGGSGGGIMAYTYLRVDEKTKNIQKLLYNNLIAKTGLKGNRANPLASADLGECRLTKMPAVLLECGFMDSKTDVPIILTDDFADKCAAAIVEALVSLGSLTKKAAEAPVPSQKLYRVQVGAYRNEANAKSVVKTLAGIGIDAIIVKD